MWLHSGFQLNQKLISGNRLREKVIKKWWNQDNCIVYVRLIMNWTDVKRERDRIVTPWLWMNFLLTSGQRTSFIPHFFLSPSRWAQINCFTTNQLLWIGCVKILWSFFFMLEERRNNLAPYHLMTFRSVNR